MPRRARLIQYPPDLADVPPLSVSHQIPIAISKGHRQIQTQNYPPQAPFHQTHSAMSLNHKSRHRLRACIIITIISMLTLTYFTFAAAQSASHAVQLNNAMQRTQWLLSAYAHDTTIPTKNGRNKRARMHSCVPICSFYANYPLTVSNSTQRAEHKFRRA